MGKLFTNLKKRVAILTVLCMMLTLAPSPAFATTVSDISGHWAQTTIQSWVDNGLIKGYPDGTFKPDNNITRAEFITLVNRAFEYTNTAPISFTDVNQNAWYASAIGVAVEAGYISGYPDGTMKPENPISREEAATIIMRIKNLVANPAAVSVYTDASSITWGKGEVGAVTAAKIMQGYPDGSFMPRGLITRAETVIALDNAMKYVAGSVTPLAPSVTRNDDTNTVSGMTTAMEYKLDSANYATYVASAFNALDFSGNHTLLVRFAALGINPFGPATTLTFTTNIGGGGGGGGNGDGSNDTAVSAINITGSAVVGATLTAIGLLPTDATVSYQWEISTDGAIYADIALATGITYTPVAGDAGKYIKVSATGTGSYDGTVTSEATTAVLTEEEADQAAADAVDVLIAALPAAGTVELTDQTQIEEARAAYDLLTPDQLALMTELEATLIAAEDELVVLTEAAIAAINAGGATVQNYTDAGITGVTSNNIAGVNTAVAAAKVTKGSDLTSSEIQAVVDKGAAIKAINAGTAILETYTVAEITGVTEGNLANVNTAVVAAKADKGSDLTRSEIQDVVDRGAAIKAANDASEAYLLAGGLDTDAVYVAVQDALTADPKVTADIEDTTALLEAATTALEEAAALEAAVTAAGEAQTAYTTAGGDVALAVYTNVTAALAAEPQVTADIEDTTALLVTATTALEDAAAALAGINAGTEVFADFATAGVTGAIETSKAGYDTAIAAAIVTKGSDLTLAEVQSEVDAVNTAVFAATELAGINAGTEVFADFATAGVTGAIEASKAGYDTAIAAAIVTKGSDLTLAEVQSEVDAVNP